jgi:hypothetical protein
VTAHLQAEVEDPTSPVLRRSEILAQRSELLDLVKIAGFTDALSDHQREDLLKILRLSSLPIDVRMAVATRLFNPAGCFLALAHEIDVTLSDVADGALPDSEHEEGPLGCAAQFLDAVRHIDWNG